MPRNEKQRLKILYIADYLMKETDDELDENDRPLHGVLLGDIKDYLKDNGIDAEEHAIRRDIDLLNGIYKKTENGKQTDITYFTPLLDVIGGKGKPIYLGERYFPFEDLEIIAECIASANFISRNEAEDLIEKLKKLCSKYQEDRLKSEYIVVERPKYTEKKMLKYLYWIKDAIKNNQKITFFYTRHSPKKITDTENRRKGERYIVSPYRVVLSNGNHYLIGYDDRYHRIMSYRIDRMDDVKTKSEPREGEDKFKRLGISDYAKQTFGMFIGGNADYITLLFHNDLLDTMMERFGADKRLYTKVDDTHFTVKTFIVESENFYGWVCGLGEKIVIIDPPEVAERFKDYLQKIQANYQ